MAGNGFRLLAPDSELLFVFDGAVELGAYGEIREWVEGRVWPPPEAAGQGPWDSSGFRLGAGDR